MDVPLPTAPIAQGTFPIGFGTHGELKMPGTQQPRLYSLELTPVQFSSTQAGISGAWKAKLSFETQ
jgi:hypothetical protein